jgi:peptide-methionine (S)-S-oxide reductase
MSLQPDALSAMQFPPNSQRAIFAGGCFWGLEELYRKDWGKKGLLDCRVGYTGGETKAPSYNAVCSGRTGHAESLLVVFDPDRVTYPQLVEYFFKMHDPTTLNRQGADSGTQYRSAVYAENDEQLKIAEEIKQKVGEQWYKGKTISTEIKRATQWYDAEDYHQEYLSKEPMGYHCPAHYVRPFPALK